MSSKCSMKSSGSRGSASASAPAPVDPSNPAVVEALKAILVSNCEGLHESAIEALLTKGVEELRSGNTTPGKLPVYQISTDCFLNLEFGAAIPFTNSLVMTAGHVDLSEDDLKQYEASYNLFGLLSDSLDFQFLTPILQPGQRIESFTYRGEMSQLIKYKDFRSFDNIDTFSEVTIVPIKPINAMFCCIKRSSADGEWVPGQSGTLIGGLNGDGKYDALYMVLARSKGNHFDAIGLCLPSMLGMMLDLKNIIDPLRLLKGKKYFQELRAEWDSMFVPPVLRALALYSACYEKLNHDDFELITGVSSTFKEKMKEAEGEYKMTKTNLNRLNSWLKSKFTTFGALMERRRSPPFNGNENSMDSFNDFDKMVIRKAIELKNAKIMKGILLMECKDKDGNCNEDSCWICECEKDIEGGALYADVWNVIDKIHNAGVEYPKDAATKCETINKQFTYWKESNKPVKMKDFSSTTKSTAGVTMKSGVVGHHPLICERNPHNVGETLSHVCFRPSHLNRLSGACNNLCIYLQFIDNLPISIE